MTESLKIGIIGAGSNTRAKHIPKLLEIPGVRIEVVCNRSEESSRRAADEFGIPRTASQWQEVVADPDLDAVVIGTWPYLHAPISIAALEAGKHVLCEARMAMNAHEADAMLAAAERHPDLVAQIVPSPFTLHWDRFIQRNLAEGLIGDLLAVDVFATSHAFLNPDLPMSWRQDIRLSGLNVMGMGIYYEAMARWTGHAKTVKALGRVQVKQRPDETGTLQDLYVPDHVDVFGELHSGASYHLRCSQITGACPTPDDFILYGEKGTLRLDLTQKQLWLSTPDQPDPRLLQVPEAEQGFWRVEAEFIGAIRGEEPVRLTSFPEACAYMHFTQKVADELQIAPSEVRKP
ncbi:MAG: Gfo/Idh/MocA family protein [Kiritimatiellia bacterium]